jgi:hypothetical protein
MMSITYIPRLDKTRRGGSFEWRAVSSQAMVCFDCYSVN